MQAQAILQQHRVSNWKQKVLLYGYTMTHVELRALYVAIVNVESQELSKVICDDEITSDSYYCYFTVDLNPITECTNQEDPLCMF